MARPARPSINLETRQPVSTVYLGLMPTRPLRMGLGEFLTFPAKEEMAARRATISLRTRQEALLDIGDGDSIPGLDTEDYNAYDAKLKDAADTVYALTKTIHLKRVPGGAIELEFIMNFDDTEQRKEVIDKPLFPATGKTPVELFVRLPRPMLVAESEVNRAYDALSARINDESFPGVVASRELGVTRPTLFSRKRQR